MPAVCARACAPRDAVWFSIATATRIAAPPSASQPMSGWNTKISATKNGVHGMSKSALTTGEATIRWTDSRSAR